MRKNWLFASMLFLICCSGVLFAQGNQFAIAIEKGDIGAIRALVEGGASPDTLIEYGDHKITPLMKACWDGEQEIAEYLLDRGAQVNAVDEMGKTALNNAISRDRVELVEVLIARGAKVNTRDSYEFTPITSAASAGNLQMVEVLVKAGADLKTETHGLTPLVFAASAGNVEMIQLLVKLGAPVNHPSLGGDSGSTALIFAIYSGKTETVQALIDLKANVNVKTKSGNTPVKAAQQGDQTEMLALLKAAGAKEAANLKLDPPAKKAPVKVEAAPGDRTFDPEKTEALWSAVEKGDVAAAKILIAEGADVHALGSYNRSMVLAACDTGSVELLEVLIRAGADVNIANEYKIAPLASAAEQGKRDVVEALIRSGANVNARNNYGGTALQVAVMRGYTEIVKILIDAGADVARDRKELLELARQENHADIEKLLLSAKK